MKGIISILKSMSANEATVSGKGFQDWGGMVLVLILSVMVSLVLGLALVWFNIGRMDMAYELKKVQGELDQKSSLSAKLEIERDRLVSPDLLFNKAKELGLGPAKVGQIRTLPSAP